MRRLPPVALFLFIAAAALAACQGGATNVPPLFTGTPASPFPAVTPFAVTSTTPLPAPVNGVSTVQLPQAQGFGGAVAFPITNPSPGLLVTATYSSVVPTGVKPLGKGRRVQDTAPVHTTVLYACITFSQTVTTGAPSFTFTAPPQYLQANVKWFYDILVGQSPTDPNAQWQTYAGPVEPNGGAITFTGPAAITWQANIPICFGVVVETPEQPNPPTPTPGPTLTPPVPTPTPTATPVGQTPTPVPTATPSGNPTPVPTATPTSVPTPTPTATPVGQTPTPVPTATPTGNPTPVPTATPTNKPTATPAPTATPTSIPTATPTATPGATPTPTPTPGVTPTPTPTPGATPTPTPTPTPTATPKPTATPSPTPSPTPVPGALSASPNPVSVFGTGAANAQTITVHETGYVLAFTESDTCNPAGGTIATVTTSNANGPTATYTVTGVKAGSCDATFKDAFNQSATTHIVVTTSGFIIQGTRW